MKSRMESNGMWNSLVVEADTAEESVMLNTLYRNYLGRGVPDLKIEPQEFKGRSSDIRYRLTVRV